MEVSWCLHHTQKQPDVPSTTRRCPRFACANAYEAGSPTRDRVGAATPRADTRIPASSTHRRRRSRALTWIEGSEWHANGVRRVWCGRGVWLRRCGSVMRVCAAVSCCRGRGRPGRASRAGRTRRGVGTAAMVSRATKPATRPGPGMSLRSGGCGVVRRAARRDRHGGPGRRRPGDVSLPGRGRAVPLPGGARGQRRFPTGVPGVFGR